MSRKETAQPDIELKDVSFQYLSADTPNVRRINLSVDSGEFIVLTGGSGCGKTTLTRIINGLAEKFYEGKMSGSAFIFGKPISDYPLCQIGKNIGSIFQDPKSQFFASITEDEIAFGCENYGVPLDELKKRVLDALRHINGNMLRGKEIYPMSSGEKQKIAVASVNAVNPQIYVFDEPSANLDMYSVEALRVLMQDLKTTGHTVIVAEHRLYYLAGLADRILYMENGELKKEWSQTELLVLSEKERHRIGIRAADLHRIAVDILPKTEGRESLSVERLSFSYRKHPVFRDITFQAYCGDIIAVVGHNGVGKTTLANILCGIQKEKDGRILFNGKELPAKKRRKAAYFVMQNTDCQLFGDSVLEELKLNGNNGDERRMMEILELYGLADLQTRHPATLSGGQKQRLALAVSDWIDTPILILDEPTSGLDFQNMANISQHIKKLAAAGKTVIMITHDYEFATMTCNRVLFFSAEDQIESFSVENNLEKLRYCFYSH